MLDFAEGRTDLLVATTVVEVGIDVDKAVFQVNNRVQAALPRLPDEVRRNGVTVQKPRQNTFAQGAS